MAPPAPANIRVLVRVRPLNESERTEHGIIGRTNVLNIDTSSAKSIDFGEENNNKENGAIISMNNLVDSNRRVTSGDFRAGYTSDGEMNGGGGGLTKQYIFDAVHGERSTQSEVYDSVKGIVDAVVDGYNGTIVAYGQTGSGKTHTVFGTGIEGDEIGAGLVQRSLRDIFKKIEMARANELLSNDETDDHPTSNSKTTFQGSFFEIFNERVYDLLSSESLEKSLAVREDRNRVYVEGLTEVEVRSTQDAENLLAKGLANRHVASTNMNRTSSRSHAIFVLSVKTEHVTSDGLRKIRTSKFTLVDLAGSERQKSTATMGNRLKEASMINKSLLCLGHVINALVDKENGRDRHVPFRNSKLTFLLKDTWGGNSKTCLVATVSPSGVAQGETISTLTFAQRAKLIKNNAILNEDTCGTVAALQAEVAKLKSKLEKSSYVDPEKFMMDNMDGGDNEVIASLKWLNKRAESRIAELEKKISDETEKNNTLKRKLHQETMTRKFKERRLEYLSRRHPNAGDDDQVAVLRDEITALQRTLQAPSEDAIEWRVAYEEAKEALEKAMERDSDHSKLEIRNSELEETAHRLCAEKLDLQERVKELTESSTETRKEIESIMDEVEKLERDMMCCQERLRQREVECQNFESRAIAAESKLQDLVDISDKLSTEKELLTEQIHELQEKLNEKSETLSTLMKTVEQKNADFIELESLHEENKKELHLTIERLQKELDESQAMSDDKDALLLEMQQNLARKSEENCRISEELQNALLEITKHKESISELENKIEVMIQEKDDVIELMKKEHYQRESDMLERIQSLEEKITDLSVEKENTEARLSCAKEQAELSSEKLENKEMAIKECEAELARVSEQYKLDERELKAELSAVQEKLYKVESRVGLLSSKLSEAEECKAAILKESEDEKSQLAYNLGNEIDGLKASLNRANLEQTQLKERLLQSEKHSIELQDNIESMKSTLAAKEHEIVVLREKQEQTVKCKVAQVEESRLQLQDKISDLECERDELLEEVFIMNEELRHVATENLDLECLLRDNKAEVLRLTAVLEEVEHEKNNYIRIKDREQQELIDELTHYKNSEADLRNKINEKETKISEIASQFSALQELLNDTKIKLQHSIDDQESWKRSCHESNEKLCAEKESFKKAQIEFEAKLKHYTTENTKLEEISAEYSRKLHEAELKHTKFQQETKDELSKLDDAKGQIALLQQKYDNLLKEKEEQSDIWEIKIRSLESDCSSLRKQNKAIALSEVELQDKYNRLKDRYVLLERQRGNLEFEIDTMQADHDAVQDQIHVMSERIFALEEENKRLKTCIENNVECRDSHSGNFEVISSSGSTWNSDSRLSYDTLKTNMDSLTERMSAAKSQPSNIITELAHESTKDDHDVNEDLDDSFDESLFLPNSEDQVQVAGSASGQTRRDDLAQEKIQLEVYHEDDENKGKTSSVTFCSTPRKGKGDYGNRRIPLSDRKNQTPLTSQSKRLRSSTKKVMSSSKKSRTNYLLIDNRQLFN